MCALLGYYAGLSDSSVPTFRDKLSVKSSKGQEVKKILEEGTDNLFRNVGAELSLNAA
jgi:hypothetical protein